MGAFQKTAFGLMAALVIAAPVSAGWITIKNDTDKTIVVQETSTLNGKLTKGKSYHLTPGEVLKEFQTGAGEKTVLLSEKDGIQAPVKVKLSWGKDDAAFSVAKKEAEIKLAVAKPK